MLLHTSFALMAPSCSPFRLFSVLCRSQCASISFLLSLPSILHSTLAQHCSATRAKPLLGHACISSLPKPSAELLCCASLDGVPEPGAKRALGHISDPMCHVREPEATWLRMLRRRDMRCAGDMRSMDFLRDVPFGCMLSWTCIPATTHIMGPSIQFSLSAGANLLSAGQLPVLLSCMKDFTRHDRSCPA